MCDDVNYESDTSSVEVRMCNKSETTSSVRVKMHSESKSADEDVQRRERQIIRTNENVQYNIKIHIINTNQDLQYGQGGSSSFGTEGGQLKDTFYYVNHYSY